MPHPIPPAARSHRLFFFGGVDTPPMTEASHSVSEPYTTVASVSPMDVDPDHDHGHQFALLPPLGAADRVTVDQPDRYPEDELFWFQRVDVHIRYENEFPSGRYPVVFGRLVDGSSVCFRLEAFKPQLTVQLIVPDLPQNTLPEMKAHDDLLPSCDVVKRKLNDLLWRLSGGVPEWFTTRLDRWEAQGRRYPRPELPERIDTVQYLLQERAYGFSDHFKRRLYTVQYHKHSDGRRLMEYLGEDTLARASREIDGWATSDDRFIATVRSHKSWDEQLAHRLDLTHSSWCRVRRSALTPVPLNGGGRISSCDHEYIVPEWRPEAWARDERTIAGHPPIRVAYLRVGSYDPSQERAALKPLRNPTERLKAAEAILVAHDAESDAPGRQAPYHPVVSVVLGRVGNARPEHMVQHTFYVLPKGVPSEQAHDLERWQSSVDVRSTNWPPPTQPDRPWPDRPPHTHHWHQLAHGEQLYDLLNEFVRQADPDVLLYFSDVDDFEHSTMTWLQTEGPRTDRTVCNWSRLVDFRVHDALETSYTHYDAKSGRPPPRPPLPGRDLVGIDDYNMLRTMFLKPPLPRFDLTATKGHKGLFTAQPPWLLPVPSETYHPVGRRVGWWVHHATTDHPLSVVKAREALHEIVHEAQVLHKIDECASMTISRINKSNWCNVSMQNAAKRGTQFLGGVDTRTQYNREGIYVNRGDLERLPPLSQPMSQSTYPVARLPPNLAQHERHPQLYDLSSGFLLSDPAFRTQGRPETMHTGARRSYERKARQDAVRQHEAQQPAALVGQHRQTRYFLQGLCDTSPGVGATTAVSTGQSRVRARRLRKRPSASLHQDAWQRHQASQQSVARVHQAQVSWQESYQKDAEAHKRQRFRFSFQGGGCAVSSAEYKQLVDRALTDKLAALRQRMVQRDRAAQARLLRRLQLRGGPERSTTTAVGAPPPTSEDWAGDGFADHEDEDEDEEDEGDGTGWSSGVRTAQPVPSADADTPEAMVEDADGEAAGGGGLGGGASNKVQFKGGNVRPNKEFVYRQPVWSLDFKSLYPSNIISENIGLNCVLLHPWWIQYCQDQGYEIRWIPIGDGKTCIAMVQPKTERSPDGTPVHSYGQEPGRSRVAQTCMYALSQRQKFKNEVAKFSDLLEGAKKGTPEQCAAWTSQLAGLSATDPATKKRYLKLSRWIEGARACAADPGKQLFYAQQISINDSRQLEAKTAANAVYGGLTAKNSFMVRLEVGAAVTAVGRWMQDRAAELLMRDDLFYKHYRAQHPELTDTDCPPFEIAAVGGDTDSVWMLCRRPTPVEVPLLPADTYDQRMKNWSWDLADEGAAYVTSKLPHPQVLELEGIKVVFVLRKKKKTYLALEWERGKNKYAYVFKGLGWVKRSVCRWSERICRAVGTKRLDQADVDVLDIINKGILDLLSGSVLIEDLLITIQMNKPVYEYDNPDQEITVAIKRMMEKETPGYVVKVGARLQYVVANVGHVPYHVQSVRTVLWAQEQARQAPTSVHAFLDLEYYIRIQLGSQLKQMLGDWERRGYWTVDGHLEPFREQARNMQSKWRLLQAESATASSAHK